LEGLIVFSIKSVDSINRLIKGKLNFYVWNAESTNPKFPLNYDRDVCLGELKRSKNDDDSLKCNGPSAKNIFIYTESKIDDQIILRIRVREAGLIQVFFVNGGGQESEVGSIRFPKDAHLKKVMMHTLSFQTNISDCDEMPNFEINLLSIKNNSREGNSFVVKGDEKFVCFNKTGVKLKDGKIIQSVN
jgi:hypothetical protein